MTNPYSLLSFLHHVEQLKLIPRTGYRQLGLPEVENVAEHSYSVIWYALLLADAEGASSAKVLKLALVHDLPESVVGDISWETTHRYLDKKTKHQIEHSAMQDIVTALPKPMQLELIDLLDEHQSGETLEAKVVHNADKLQLLHQLLRYEQLYNPGSTVFWEEAATIAWLPSAKSIYDELADQHKALNDPDRADSAH